MYAEQLRKWYYQETFNYVYFGDIMDGTHFVIKKEGQYVTIQLMKVKAEEWLGIEPLNYVCAKVRSQLRLFNHTLTVQ